MSATEEAKKTMAMERVSANLPVEVGASAAAAQMGEMVKARFTMAVARPRIMEQVRQDLLKECSRPSFALEKEKGKGNSALYRKPVGNGRFAKGLGIRFAEVAERCMGNLDTGAITIQDSPTERVKYCYVLDLQTNNSWADTVHITKTVERLSTNEGDEIISSRVNSKGQTTYTIAASEDALVTKEAALISKKLRTLILRMIPGDIQDQCIAKIREVRASGIAEDPDAAIRRVIDGMYNVNVDVVMLEAYLGHPVKQCTAAEIVNLQGLYAAINDGEATWAAIMEDVDKARTIKPSWVDGDESQEGEETPTNGKGVEAAKEKIAEEQKAEQKKEAAAKKKKEKEQVAAKDTATESKASTEETEPELAHIPGEVSESTQDEKPAATTPQPAQGAAPPWASPKTEAKPPSAPQPPPAQPTGEHGKEINGIIFPVVMTRTGDADKFTDEQLATVSEVFAKINEASGKTYKLDKCVKSWLQCDLDDVSKDSMACLILALNNKLAEQLEANASA